MTLFHTSSFFAFSNSKLTLTKWSLLIAHSCVYLFLISVYWDSQFVKTYTVTPHLYLSYLRISLYENTLNGKGWILFACVNKETFHFPVAIVVLSRVYFKSEVTNVSGLHLVSGSTKYVSMRHTCYILQTIHAEAHFLQCFLASHLSNQRLHSEWEDPKRRAGTQRKECLLHLGVHTVKQVKSAEVGMSSYSLVCTPTIGKMDRRSFHTCFRARGILLFEMRNMIKNKDIHLA